MSVTAGNRLCEGKMGAVKKAETRAGDRLVTGTIARLTKPALRHIKAPTRRLPGPAQPQKTSPKKEKLPPKKD
jgi:hypothetical protein